MAPVGAVENGQIGLLFPVFLHSPYIGNIFSVPFAM
jgi:hypothetical protein